MPIPVLSVSQMRAWEQATWASGQTEAAVIALVGRHLWQRVLTATRSGDFVLLLAGRGHNGDDVRAMLPCLADRRMQLLEVTDPAKSLPELRNALAKKPSIVVDGLFGIGLSRPLASEWIELIACLNESRARVLAVDVPSGFDAVSGAANPDAVRAWMTLTVGAPKAGLLKAGAAEFVGRLEVAHEVGLLLPCPEASEVQWTLAKDFSDFPLVRPVDSHKGTFGHVGTIAGSFGFHGAAVLAARGAQRARPGLITLLPQADVYGPIAAQLQAVMAQPWTLETDLSRFSSLLIGPGLAARDLPSALRDWACEIWRSAPQPVVVDASALEWLPRGSSSDSLRVITPHPGEAARLLGCTTAQVQSDRVAALRKLAQAFHCCVVLKGAHTLIGGAEGEVFVNSSGNSGLAQGGSGDLLAGFIAGWLAQPAMQPKALQTIRYAVFEHGAAADRLSARRQSWTVEELATELGG